MRDCFSAAALLSGDGAFLLTVMGPHTFNAGKIYFPCGTPDPNDVVADKVDLDLSVRRELKEETGLDITEFDAEAGWDMVVDGPLIALIKVLRSTEKAIDLRKPGQLKFTANLLVTSPRDRLSGHVRSRRLLPKA